MINEWIHILPHFVSSYILFVLTQSQRQSRWLLLLPKSKIHFNKYWKLWTCGVYCLWWKQNYSAGQSIQYEHWYIKEVHNQFQAKITEHQALFGIEIQRKGLRFGQWQPGAKGHRTKPRWSLRHQLFHDPSFWNYFRPAESPPLCRRRCCICLQSCSGRPCRRKPSQGQLQQQVGSPSHTCFGPLVGTRKCIHEKCCLKQ